MALWCSVLKGKETAIRSTDSRCNVRKAGVIFFSLAVKRTTKRKVVNVAQHLQRPRICLRIAGDLERINSLRPLPNTETLWGRGWDVGKGSNGFCIGRKPISCNLNSYYNDDHTVIIASSILSLTEFAWENIGLFTPKTLAGPYVEFHKSPTQATCRWYQCQTHVQYENDLVIEFLEM